MKQIGSCVGNDVSNTHVEVALRPTDDRRETSNGQGTPVFRNPIHLSEVIFGHQDQDFGFPIKTKESVTHGAWNSRPRDCYGGVLDSGI